MFFIFMFFFYFGDIEGDSITGAAPAFRFDYSFSELADGWLKLHRIPATWSDAKLQCHAEGAVLVSPTSEPLKRALADSVSELDPALRRVHTGVHATFSPGSYNSIEGLPLSEMSLKWAPGEPDNFQNSERCLAMTPTNSTTGVMADVNCDRPLPYVCYKKKADVVLNKCGTSDLAYSLDALTGSCYKFHRRGLAWARAFATCQAEGAHLAVVNGDREALALKDLFAENPSKKIFSRYSDFAWVGLRDANDGGSWMTIHIETLAEAGYMQWYPGEPNNSSQPEGELCAGTHRDGGGFVDLPCHGAYAFICEMRPGSLQLLHS